MPEPSRLTRLRALHGRLDACAKCPKMVGPVVHGPAVVTGVFLLGQAPGIKEGPAQRPFAWTAGKTLFSWFQRAVGADEATVRERIYFSAVARCFPGKAPSGGGDRKPDPVEIAACQPWIREEVQVLEPSLVLPVGALAIEQVLGHKGPLAEIIGTQRRTAWHGVTVDVIPLPHPSGASTWHRKEPGLSLLAKALERVAAHPQMVQRFPRASKT